MFYTPRRPDHDFAETEEAVDDEEEGVPETDHAVHCREVVIEVVADVVDDCNTRKKHIRNREHVQLHANKINCGQ